MDDDGQVVQGEGVGEVGDDDQDGGREEGGQNATHQWSRQLKNHQEPRTVLRIYLPDNLLFHPNLNNGRAHFNSYNCVLDQLPWSRVGGSL